MAKIFIVDTETTGLDPATDRVVELAAIRLEQVDDVTWEHTLMGSSFVNPRRPIPPEASAVHHIVDSDVADAPDLGEAIDHLLTPFWFDNIHIIAAHNARFDRDFLPPLKEKRWIDTYRCAMHVWPDAPSFKNAVLFYWRGFKRIEPVEPHRAAYDALLTTHLLIALLAERTVDELLRLSTKAVVLRTVRFGKHSGSLWTEVPIDYLQWASRQDFDPDVKFTVKTEIARRAGVGRGRA
jgi:exodeoxyribonuclease X